jgi:hypothetical protein
MVEAELSFFEMDVEGMFGNAAEPGQASFGKTPEALDAIDVVALPSELVVPVFHPEVLVETQIHQPMVAGPAIGVEHRAEARSAADHRLQRGFAGVGHDGRVDLITTLEQAEDDGFAATAAAHLSAHALGTKVRFVKLQHTFQGRLLLASRCDLSAHAQKDRIHRANRNADHAGRLRRRQIQGKTPHQMPKLPFTQFGTSKITVSPRHYCTLSPPSTRLLPKPHADSSASLRNDNHKNRQMQQQQQIPFGNDNQKNRQMQRQQQIPFEDDN